MSIASSPSTGASAPDDDGPDGLYNELADRQRTLRAFAPGTLRDMGFQRGAGNQWYRNTPLFGNGDPSDNHVHLMGRNHGDNFVVTGIELKLRLAGRPIRRVFLVRLFDGTYALPVNPPHGMTGAELRVASRMYNRLSAALVALPQNTTNDTAAEVNPVVLPAMGSGAAAMSWRK